MHATLEGPAGAGTTTIDYAIEECPTGFSQRVTARRGASEVVLERLHLVEYDFAQEDAGQWLEFQGRDVYYLSVKLPTNCGTMNVLQGTPDELRVLGELVGVAIAEATRRGVLPAAGAEFGGAHVGN